SFPSFPLAAPPQTPGRSPLRRQERHLQLLTIRLCAEFSWYPPTCPPNPASGDLRSCFAPRETRNQKERDTKTQRYTLVMDTPAHVTGVPLPKAHPTPPDQRRRHVAHGPRCPRLHASDVEGSWAKRPVAKSGPITPCEGRCRRCQQATRTRVAL